MIKRIKLTKRAVDQASPPIEVRQAFIWDTDVSGFGLRITKAGTKSYIFQYRNTSGTAKRKTIGKHGAITADNARQIAREWYFYAKKGGDPAADARSARDAPSISDLCDDYLSRHAQRNKRARSLEGDIDYINRFIKPAWGRKKVLEVSLADVERLAASLGERKTTANRLVSLLSKMFNLARKWGWCARNPTEGWQKNTETKRERYLSTEELTRLLTLLEVHPNQRACYIVRLLLLTGARSGEVLGMKWSNVDLELGRWTKPAHTTKQKRTEIIPLSEAALGLLRELRSGAPVEAIYVFPGNSLGKPMTTIKTFWGQVRRDAGINDVRLHDLRHTFASHLVSSGQSLETIGRLLGHTQAQTTARYAHLQDDALRKATNLFASASGYTAKNHNEN